MKTQDTGRARRALLVPASALLAAGAAQDVHAATAADREFSMPGSSTQSITFNVVDEGLVSGAIRPLQLVSASSSDVSVSARLNCITVTGILDAPFDIDYTIAEGDDAAATRASGTLTFDPGSTAAPVNEILPSDPACADPLHALPTAVGDSGETISGQAVTIPLLANDVTATSASRIIIVSQPGNGTVVVQGNSVVYTPSAGYAGEDVFTYSISDYSLYTDYRSNTATVALTVNDAPPNQAPTADAGGDQTLDDTDLQPGEDVVLDASGSSDPDGSIVSHVWLDQDENQIATGMNATVRLPDGVNTIILLVTDNLGETGIATITVSIAVAPPRSSLESLTNLTPNQRAVARALDDVCGRLNQASNGDIALTPDQQALLERCNALLYNNNADRQRRALDELNGEELAAARTQTLQFANFQYAGVMDRMIALRGGAKGLSLAGLSIMHEGTLIPLAELQQMARQLLGGGASADKPEPGGLLSDKLGLWVRGNYSFGKKKQSEATPGFEADQWSLMAGVDYRLSDKAVVGVALSYGDSDVKFKPSGEGGLATTSWAGSLYGSLYAARNFYIDAIINLSDSDYEARRSIEYEDALGPVSAQARGETGGLSLSGGASMGYDFLIGGLTLSPTAGVLYVDSYIDSFIERGAAGLNLAYEQQDFTSMTTTLGLRATFAWNRSWGVLLPYLRADFVREYEDDVEVFGARFAADPVGTPSGNSAPILIRSDNPDRSYWRLAAGFSAQLPHGISGYVEYQRLESFQFVDFQDISVGLRAQRRF